MTSPAQKTPISLLQELCANHEMAAEYKLISVEGPVHAPTFTYVVKVKDVVASASGQSKQKAKHAAAKTILEMLLSPESGEYKEGFVSNGVLVNASSLDEVISESVVENPAAEEEEASGNPVGKLQEACTRRKWQPPYYEMAKDTGLPHDKTFSMLCVIDTTSEDPSEKVPGDLEAFTTFGEAKSKRLAKRQAADNMVKKLLSLNVITEDDLKPKPKEDKGSENNCNNDDSNDGNDVSNDDNNESKGDLGSEVDPELINQLKQIYVNDEIKLESESDQHESS